MYAFFFVIELIGSAVAFKLDREDGKMLVWLFWRSINAIHTDSGVTFATIALSVSRDNGVRWNRAWINASATLREAGRAGDPPPHFG